MNQNCRNRRLEYDTITVSVYKESTLKIMERKLIKEKIAYYVLKNLITMMYTTENEKMCIEALIGESYLREKDLIEMYIMQDYKEMLK